MSRRRWAPPAGGPVIVGACLLLALAAGSARAEEEHASEPSSSDSAAAGDSKAPDAATDASTPAKRRGEGRQRTRQRIPVGGGAAIGPSQEIEVPRLVRKAIYRNALNRRLAAVSRTRRFAGSAPGGGRWQREALGGGPSVPMQTAFSRDLLHMVALRDGSKLWLASGHITEPAAILRLGDLLPLLSAIGIDDREAALSVSEISFGGGSRPPAYTLTMRTGALWPHRAVLAAAERSGRITYSLVSGRVTVFGALVTADAEGDLHVEFVSPEGDDLGRYRDLVMAMECRPLERAIRSSEPGQSNGTATRLLQQPSVVQACAARYLALTSPPGAAATLRRLMASGHVGRPAEVVEAPVHLEPEFTDENLEAVAALVERAGVSGALGVCTHAPLLWSEALLNGSRISEPNSRALRRCLRR
ncbi:MAG: hypothetical protein ACOCVR_02285 [Myxococcota bacterium]